METMQPIEGVTPGMLWIALIVLVAGATLYVLYGKVRDTYRKQQEYKYILNPHGRLLFFLRRERSRALFLCVHRRQNARYFAERIPLQPLKMTA